MLARVLFTAASLASIALANVEKIIFSAPPPSFIPLASPSLEDLHLDALTPAAPSLTRNVSRAFPSESAPRGLESWYLLDNLSEGQRYELRICWAAIVSPFDSERRVTQANEDQEPTSFDIDVYELETVWEDPALISSLAAYAQAQPKQTKKDNQQGERKASVYLARVRAAADYFAQDKALMERPPPVLAELILDPYLFNAVPTSLLPTVGYILVVAALSFYVARWIAAKMASVAAADEDKKRR